jgi:hypothetical protein
MIPERMARELPSRSFLRARPRASPAGTPVQRDGEYSIAILAQMGKNVKFGCIDEAPQCATETDQQAQTAQRTAPCAPQNDTRGQVFA